jgi:hypothetical protein
MAGIGDYEKGKKFTLKSGNTTPFKQMGSSPAKQVDPLDLGLIDEAKKVKVSTMPKGFNMSGKDPWVKESKDILSKKKVPKIKDVTGKRLTNIILKGDKLPAEKIIKKHATQKAIKDANKIAKKKAIKKKAIKKAAKKIGTKFLGPVGAALTAYDVGKFAHTWYKTGDVEKAWDKHKWWGSEKGNLFKKDDK